MYNADATLAGLLTDFVHRSLSPETYACNLCHVTYDRFTMKREWRGFVESLPYRASFQLRDRFRKKYPALADIELPACFTIESLGAQPKLLVSASDFASQHDVDSMKQLLEHKLAEQD